MNVSERRLLLKSRVPFPDTYIIESDGMIFPGCYTEYEAVEKMFASPKRMLYYLSKNDDIAIELDPDIITKVHYQDSEIANSLRSYFCRLWPRSWLSLRNRIAGLPMESVLVASLPLFRQ